MSSYIPGKLSIAVLAALFLADLHLYIYRFHQPSDMLGLYLRKHVEQSCSRPGVGQACVPNASGSPIQSPQGRSISDGMFRV